MQGAVSSPLAFPVGMPGRATAEEALSTILLSDSCSCGRTPELPAGELSTEVSLRSARPSPRCAGGLKGRRGEKKRKEGAVEAETNGEVEEAEEVGEDEEDRKT